MKQIIDSTKMNTKCPDCPTLHFKELINRYTFEPTYTKALSQQDDLNHRNTTLF